MLFADSIRLIWGNSWLRWSSNLCDKSLLEEVLLSTYTITLESTYLSTFSFNSNSIAWIEDGMMKTCDPSGISEPSGKAQSVDFEVGCAG